LNTDDKTDDIHGDNGWMLDTKNYKTTAHKGKEKTWTTGKKATTGAQLEAVATASPLPEVERMTKYFADKGIGFDALAAEISEEFGEERCISVNSKDEANGHQIMLNTLEDKDNPYRAIFAVDKLNEGWDVLNLFDIVRLYETRDAKNGKPGKTTISEAQLIGRGARYFPFMAAEGQERGKRKYDSDIDNPLRVCEELYYHCQYDSRYIAELHKALIATGIMADETKQVTYSLKPEFKRELLYREGLVFTNRREVTSREDVTELLPSIREKEYTVAVSTGRTATDILMNDAHTNTTIKVVTSRITIGDIAKYNYSIVHSALRKFGAFKFNLLQIKFPNLKSIREFITDTAYLGGIKIVIDSREAAQTPEILFSAVKNVLGKIAAEISAIRETYVGTTEFKDRLFKEIFTGKTLNLADIEDAEQGASQNSARDASLRMDLSVVDWYAFNDNFGTSEEKAFVKYFSSHVEDLKKKYIRFFLCATSGKR
jgi:type III restriction enzyme